MTTKSSDERVSGRAVLFLVSEQRCALADERRTLRCRQSGAPAGHARDLPLAARRPRGSEHAAACTALGRIDRASPGASDVARFALGRRAVRRSMAVPPPLCTLWSSTSPPLRGCACRCRSSTRPTRATRTAACRNVHLGAVARQRGLLGRLLPAPGCPPRSGGARAP